MAPCWNDADVIRWVKSVPPNKVPRVGCADGKCGLGANPSGWRSAVRWRGRHVDGCSKDGNHDRREAKDCMRLHATPIGECDGIGQVFGGGWVDIFRGCQVDDESTCSYAPTILRSAFIHCTLYAIEPPAKHIQDAISSQKNRQDAKTPRRISEQFHVNP